MQGITSQWTLKGNQNTAGKGNCKTVVSQVYGNW